MADENVFRKNFQKLVVRVLFICAVCIKSDNLLQVKQAVLASMYSGFKGQVILADLFNRQFGQIQRG